MPDRRYLDDAHGAWTDFECGYGELGVGEPVWSHGGCGRRGGIGGSAGGALEEGGRTLCAAGLGDFNAGMKTVFLATWAEIGRAHV